MRGDVQESRFTAIQLIPGRYTSNAKLDASVY